MSHLARIAFIAALVFLAPGRARAHTIPQDQLDRTKVFWGDTKSFEKPGEVDFDEVIKATPEYQEVKKDKIKRGTGKFWLLMSKASTRALRAIAQVGEDTEYDLVAAKGYLGKLKPPVPAKDITELVISEITGERKKTKDEKK